MVQGNPADAWRYEDLPREWRIEITRRAANRNVETGEQYLSYIPLLPWPAPLPWNQIRQKERDKADKLQKAMARALEAWGRGVRGAELERIGMEDYAREFGYPLKDARHWRRLLRRTLERDAGEQNWQRLEIYLHERAFVAPRLRPAVVRQQAVHRELDEVVATVEDRQKPTPTDRQFIWDAACRHYERHTEQLPDSPIGNRERRLFKASLAYYLFAAFPAGTLCASEGSLRRLFKEKLDLWRQNGRTPEALQDLRPIKSGKFRKVQFPEDLAAIRDRAILHDGNIALAHRLLREEGRLSKEFCEFYPFDVRTAKSEVPHAVRAAIQDKVEMCLPLRRGPWQARMRGPYIPRDWSEVKPADYFSADDVTWNHYFREQLRHGTWRVLRGECLLMVDLRTGYPLAHMLISGHYNGEHVRGLVLKAHDLVGLPRCGFYFEKGVWASRLVTGDSRQGTPVHWREAENGLCGQGLALSVRHATTPRAKPIEGLLRILQDRMRSIPGFVGFNEREYDAERMQSLIARANRQDEAALKQFPTPAEWDATIGTVLQQFAHEPQNGEMLQGQSPAEAWAVEVRNHPLRRLPDEARYILSTHRKPITIRQEGIVLTIRGQRRLYFNEDKGRLIGQNVLAFYNLEMPELLTVSDMDRKNYFTVRAVKLPAMTATREQLEEVNRLRRAHMAPAKAIFGSIQHEVLSTITRDTEQDQETKDLGRFHNQETARAKADDSARGRKLRRLQVKAARAGIEVPRAPRNVDDLLEAVDRRVHFLQALREEEERKAAGNREQEVNS